MLKTKKQTINQAVRRLRAPTLDAISFTEQHHPRLLLQQVARHLSLAQDQPAIPLVTLQATQAVIPHAAQTQLGAAEHLTAYPAALILTDPTPQPAILPGSQAKPPATQRPQALED